MKRPNIDAAREARMRHLEYLKALASDMRALLTGNRPPYRVESRMREYQKFLRTAHDTDQGLFNLYEAAVRLIIATEARYDKDKNSTTILNNTLIQIERVIATEQAGYQRKHPMLIIYEILKSEGHTEPNTKKWHEAVLKSAGKTENDFGWGERSFRRAIAKPK